MNVFTTTPSLSIHIAVTTSKRRGKKDGQVRHPVLELRQSLNATTERTRHHACSGFQYGSSSLHHRCPLLCIKNKRKAQGRGATSACEKLNWVKAQAGDSFKVQTREQRGKGGAYTVDIERLIVPVIFAIYIFRHREREEGVEEAMDNSS